jgi:hypothetical protein
LIYIQFADCAFAAQSAKNLEREAHLSLEVPLDRSWLAENCSALACDLAERRGGADGEIGSIGLRMIQDVCGVQSNGQCFGFAKTERFRDVPIQEEYAGPVERTVPERSDLSRSGIHQNVNDR